VRKKLSVFRGNVRALLSNIQTLDGHDESFCARRAKRFSKSPHPCRKRAYSSRFIIRPRAGGPVRRRKSSRVTVTSPNDNSLTRLIKIAERISEVPPQMMNSQFLKLKRASS
jgi:hypothetical protein